MTESASSRPATSKHRIDALSDGIHAIVMTLLVLELKLAPLSHGATGLALRAVLLLALVGLLPFSTALIGEHGDLPSAAALCGATKIAYYKCCSKQRRLH